MSGSIPTPHDGDIILKPCPFCGGDAEVERYGTPRQSCIVSCTDCGCRLDSNENGAGYHWNRREFPKGDPETMLDRAATIHNIGWLKQRAVDEDGCDISAGGGDIDDLIFHQHDNEEKI